MSTVILREKSVSLLDFFKMRLRCALFFFFPQSSSLPMLYVRQGKKKRYFCDPSCCTSLETLQNGILYTYMVYSELKICVWVIGMKASPLMDVLEELQ